MDTTLVTVTVLSMGMAAALSVIVWRMLRDERRRSEARVLALAQAAAVTHHDAIPPQGGRHRDTFQKPVPDPAASAFGRNRVLTPTDLPSRRDQERELPLRDMPVTAVTPMFVEPVQTTPWWNRFAVMAGMALFGTAVLLFILAAKGHPVGREAAPSAPAVAAAAAVPGLELLSLRDARTPEALTITGMVRNPRSGTLHARVAVTAYAFDEKGAFLSSGRALLDVTSLAPGDESPFVVSVPVTETVARYRIGFRAEDGRVIGHVDKRQAGPMAALRPIDTNQENW